MSNKPKKVMLEAAAGVKTEVNADLLLEEMIKITTEVKESLLQKRDEEDVSLLNVTDIRI
jgi:hypothetical protein